MDVEPACAEISVFIPLKWIPIINSKNNPEGVVVCDKCNKETIIHPNYINAGIKACVGPGGCSNVEDVSKAMLKVRGYTFLRFERNKEKNTRIIHFICDKGHTYHLRYETLRKGASCKTCHYKAAEKPKLEVVKYMRPICSCKSKNGKSKPHSCQHYNHKLCPNGGAEQWHYESNGLVIPEDVAPQSAAIYTYKCPEEHCQMLYQQSPTHRASQRTRCPYCSSHKVCRWNNLETNYPELCKEIDPESKIKACEVTTSSSIKIGWICDKHETPYKWEAAPCDRIRGHGCKMCNCAGYFQAIYGHSYFVQEARKVHGNKYEYPEEYKGLAIPVNIYCGEKDENDLIHGNFKQTPASHKRGSGCSKCTAGYNQLVGGHDYFVKEARKIHEDKYEYNDKYIDSHTPINIYCKVEDSDGNVHGNFLKSPTNHKNGQGCPACTDPRYAQRMGGHDYFVKVANEVHNNKYSYPDEYAGSDIKIDIFCSTLNKNGIVHGEFMQTPDNHKRGHGCPKCADEQTQSKLVRDLQTSLDSFGYSVESGRCIPEHPFKGLVYKQQLWIDRYIPEINLAAEADGGYHFRVSEDRGGIERLRENQLRDVLKDVYCINNKINLLRIPFNMEPSIELISYIANLCKQGYCVYASYDRYFQIARRITNLSHVYYLEVPVPRRYR